MLRFKTYVSYLEEAVLFSVNLTPAEWDKRPERFDKLRTAMKDKIKIIHFISKTNQREMIVKDTTYNKKIIKDFVVQADIQVDKEKPKVSPQNRSKVARQFILDNCEEFLAYAVDYSLYDKFFADIEKFEEKI